MTPSVSDVDVSTTSPLAGPSWRVTSRATDSDAAVMDHVSNCSVHHYTRAIFVVVCRTIVADPAANG